MQRYKYRLKFEKIGVMKFIGHLDFLKLFQRCVKRSKLPVSYSQGFNPHQQMSFACPISIGMESVGDYVDVEFEKEIQGDFIINALNEVLPFGTKILNARLLSETEKSGMACVDAAIYEIKLDEGFCFNKVEVDNIIVDFLNQAEINAVKKTKKGLKEENIKNDILTMESIVEDNGAVVLKIVIATGSVKNLKPDVVVEALYNFKNIHFNKYKIAYRRMDLLKMHDDIFSTIL